MKMEFQQFFFSKDVEHMNYTLLKRTVEMDDRYSNLFLNAYINRLAHTKYLKTI